MIDFIKKFTNKEIIDFDSVIKLGDEFYLVSSGLKKIQDKIKYFPSFMGLYLGKREKPSIFLLQELSKIAEKKVWVNEKGEWLFICGRDILNQSITKKSECIVKDDFVLVMNKYNECIGYGVFIDDKKPKKAAVQRMFDIGDFLRRERKGK
ncbi:MAG: hypothetical protein QW666_02930 [Candidatus Woesearchaeota archaeon]